MKLQRENLSTKKSSDRSFLCYLVEVPFFKFNWHYHPEFELTYIIEGKGRRLIGNSYTNFAEGDFVLLGPGLPHTWVSNKATSKNCCALVIQFSADVFESLFKLPEFASVATLLKNASRGLHFKRSIPATHAIEKAISLQSKKSVNATLELLSLLNQLTVCPNSPIVSNYYLPAKGAENEARINTVFQFVQNNFKGNLLLSDAAKKIHLSESAFCKFFKRISNKTFSEYVNEVRIDHACTLLIETDRPVSAIATDCGFSTIAYFNRVFLRNKKVTPRKFRMLSLASV
jgi:AraC-like DNA-binding protein